jgi:pimeloyl-ACP methyl ester carboxylesterase
MRFSSCLPCYKRVPELRKDCRPPQARYIPRIEPLESRVLLKGRAVAFFVAGYGGQTIPPVVETEVINQFAQEYKNHAITSYAVYNTDWNSPDPTARSVNPGSISGNLLAPIPGPSLLNFNIPGVSLNATLADPRLPNTFVDKLTNILDTQYDDQDFVALIGHSFGGNSVLRVADQTKRKIDVLATFDPVGWSFTGVFTTGTAVILPAISVPVPPFAQPIFGSSFTLPGTPLSVSFPVGAFATLFSGNLNDPQRGLPGFRNELPHPGSNVRYFYNRWQTNFPFPFDYSVSGQLDNNQVRNKVLPFSYLGRTIASQEPANDYRDKNGNVETHDANILDLVFGHAMAHYTLPNVDFGTPPDFTHFPPSLGHINFPPVITGGSLSFTSTSLLHQDVPNDDFLQAQLNTVFDNIAPSIPVVNAGSPQTVNEGNAVQLRGSAHTTDPNTSFAYHWTQTGGPFQVNLTGADPATQTFVAPDAGDYTFDLMATDNNTGVQGDQTVTIHVNNVPPTVSAGPAARIPLGATFVRGGSFTDPGADTWTAVVNYGDGAGNQPLGLNPDKTFNLNHVYTTPGSYVVTVTVSDNDSGVGRDAVLVTVVAPPTVQSVVLNDGSAQRSMVTSITVTFSGSVALPANQADALQLVKQGGGPVGVAVTASLVGGKTVAVLTFAGSEIIGHSLADGRYTLTTRGDRIHDDLGQELDGDADGSAGGNRVDAFFRLFGDSDGDGIVDNLDFFRFRNAFGKRVGDPGYLAYFDFDGDGIIDAAVDFAELNWRYGMRI